MKHNQWKNMTAEGDCIALEKKDKMWRTEMKRDRKRKGGLKERER